MELEWLAGCWGGGRTNRGGEARRRNACRKRWELLGREGRVSSIVYDRAGSIACMRLLAKLLIIRKGAANKTSTVIFLS
jgi:hypothetical protein